MRAGIPLLMVLATACGGDKKPVPARHPVATVDAVVDAALPAGLWLDDDGPWRRRGIFAIAFCPGDEELVAVDGEGWLTRWRVSDGTRIGATALTADPDALAAGQPAPQHPASWESGEPLDRIDCRADGTALAVGQVTRDENWTGTTIGPDGKPVPLHSSRTDRITIPFLVDRAGNRSQPAVEVDVLDSRFGADGDPRLLVDDGVLAWRADGALERVFLADDPAPDARLGANDDYVEDSYPKQKMRLRRGDRWIDLPGERDYPNELETVDDGVIVAFEMSVYVWVIKNGKKATKARQLLDATGVHVKAIAAGKKWFLAVDADSALVRMKRPGAKIDIIEHLCGDDADVTAIALSHDESRLAVACTDGRIDVRPL